MDRREFLAGAAWGLSSIILTACLSEPEQSYSTEVSGLPTIYRVAIAERTARTRAGLNPSPSFYNYKLQDIISNTSSLTQLESIRGLIINSKAYHHLLSVQPTSAFSLVRGIALGGQALPVMVAPQLCHFIPDKDPAKRSALIWHSVQIVSDYEYSAEGFVARGTPLTKEGIIFDALADNCRRLSFFSDFLARDLSELYNLHVREYSPYFLNERGVSVGRLPELRLRYLG